MTTINVKDITHFAMFEQDGMRLKEAICDALSKDDKVALDFSNVDFFTTMFFNASIGSLVLTEGATYVSERIEVNNLSELGMSTLKHSYENAKKLLDDEDYREAVRNYNEEGD